jgi:cytidylate kinase
MTSTITPVIAVDGPAASGKGTVASAVARRSASINSTAARSTGWWRWPRSSVAWRSMTSRGLAALAHGLDVTFDDAPDSARRSRRDGSDPHRAVSAAASRVAASPPSGARW